MKKLLNIIIASLLLLAISGCDMNSSLFDATCDCQKEHTNSYSCENLP